LFFGNLHSKPYYAVFFTIYWKKEPDKLTLRINRKSINDLFEPVMAPFF
jgi:hypothetical protein